MKKNYLAKKLTAALLSGTMVLSMGGMTAFADKTEPGSGESEVTTIQPDNGYIPLQKRLYSSSTSANYLKVPATSFTYNIRSARSEECADLTIKGVTYSVTPGDADAVGLVQNKGDAFATNGVTIAFDGDETFAKPGDSDRYYVDETAGAYIQLKEGEFDAPGIYRYVISEDTTNFIDGITAETNQYYLDVYVENNTAQDAETDYIIGAVVAYTNLESGVPTGKSDKVLFENLYTTYQLKVTKAVTGNQGYAGGDYTFSIDVNNAATGDDNFTVLVYPSATVPTPTVYYKSSTNNTIPENGVNLHDTGYIVILGLAKKDTYAVRELVAGQDGYTTTYYEGISDITSTSGVAAEDKHVVNAGQTEDLYEITRVSTDTEIEDDREFLVQNDRGSISPTGIAMTFAPYALMVVFAGGLAALFLRKKKEDF